MISTIANYAKLIGHDAKGRAILEGTRYRVSFLAVEHLRYRWSADDLRTNHPDLTSAQVDAVLAYYYDHRPEIEAEISEIERDWASGRASSGQPSLRELQERLRS
jgi:uncharacterized protein (DUF433 family)